MKGSPGYRAFTGGLAACAAQGLLLRDSLFAAHQAELECGMALAGWMAASCVGSLAGARIGRRAAAWSLAMASLGLLSPLVSFALRTGLAGSLAAGMAMGLPAGLLFVLPFEKGVSVRKTSALEALGALAGGAAFSLASGHLLSGALSSGIAIFALAAPAAAGSIPAMIPAALAIAAVAAGVPAKGDSVAAARGPASGADSFTIQATPRGELVTAWRSGERAVYRSGLISQWDSAPEAAEESVILPIVFSSPGRILCIAPQPDAAAMLDGWGSLPGREAILTAPDGPSFEMLSRTAPHSILLQGDERALLDEFSGALDLVIMESPLPLSLLQNRLLTTEFMRSAHRALGPGGVLAIVLPLGSNRLVPGQAEVLGPIVAAGMEVFGYSTVLPAGGAMLLLSDSAPGRPREMIAEGWGAVGPISPVFVDSSWLAAVLSDERVESYSAPLIEARADPNRDLRPLAFTASLRNWAARTGEAGMRHPVLPAAGAVIAVVLLWLFKPSSAPVLVPASLGAASLAAESAMLLTAQSVLGITWVLMALPAAIFMAGYSLGSWRSRGRAAFANALAGSLALICLSAVCILYSASWLSGTALVILSGACVAILGLASGSAFPASVGAMGGSPSAAARVGAAASSAGAAGALLYPMFLFPAIGAAGALAVTAVLPLLALVPQVLSRNGTAVRDIDIK